MKKYVDMKEALEWEEAPQDEIVEEDFSPGAPPIQKCLWNLFEHPHTSMAARIVGIISVRLELKYFHVITTDYNSLTKDHIQDGKRTGTAIFDQTKPLYLTNKNSLYFCVNQ